MGVRGGKTCLVTGGAGFVGVHLCRRLLDDGHDVVCLDDLSSGTREHVDLLSGHPRFRFIEQDVRDPIDLEVGRIFNLACPASPPAYQADPIKTTLTNVMGVHRMLELALASGARLLQASTSEVYGDPLVTPQGEDYRGNVAVSGPRACYDEGKRCAETLIDAYRSMHGLDCRITRIFNTYGPLMRADDGRVVTNFISQALSGAPLTVYGDGSQTRSLCYIDDLVEGLVRLMEHEGPLPGPVNLGNPREMTVLSLAETILSATGSDSPIVFRPIPVNDPRIRCPDITRAREWLGWEPKRALEEGLAATIAHFRARADNAAVNLGGFAPPSTGRS